MQRVRNNNLKKRCNEIGQITQELERRRKSIERRRDRLYRDIRLESARYEADIRKNTNDGRMTGGRLALQALELLGRNLLRTNPVIMITDVLSLIDTIQRQNVLRGRHAVKFHQHQRQAQGLKSAIDAIARLEQRQFQKFNRLDCESVTDKISTFRNFGNLKRPSGLFF